MASASLDLLRSANPVIVDGGFVEDPLFARLLAALRPHQRVALSGQREGTAIGAALLWRWPEQEGPGAARPQGGQRTRGQRPCDLCRALARGGRRDRRELRPPPDQGVGASSRSRLSAFNSAQRSTGTSGAKPRRSSRPRPARACRPPPRPPPDGQRELQCRGRQRDAVPRADRLDAPHPVHDLARCRGIIGSWRRSIAPVARMPEL